MPLRGRTICGNQTHRCDFVSLIRKEGEHIKGRSQIFTGVEKRVVPLRCDEEKISVSIEDSARYSLEVMVKLPWPFGWRGFGEHSDCQPWQEGRECSRVLLRGHCNHGSTRALETSLAAAPSLRPAASQALPAGGKHLPGKEQEW